MNVRDPIVLDERIEGAAAELVLRVPEGLAYFKGHFPGVPILPGVVQIKWAIAIARRCLDIHGDFAGMETLKFQHVIRPSERVSLTLKYIEETGKLRFTFHSDGKRYSSGCIRLRHAP